MRTDRFIKITYKQINSTPEELQQRLDDAFDLLFEEVTRLLEVSSKSQNFLYEH